MFRNLRVHGPQAADFDGELLALRRKAETLEQSRRIRIRRCLEQPVRPNDDRCAFAGVDWFNRLALFLFLKDQVLNAIGLDRPFAERELLRRIGR